MGNQNEHLRLLLINGETVSFASKELREFIWSRSILILVSVAVLLLFLGNPFVFTPVSDPWARVFYWGVGVFLYLLILPIYLTWLFRLWGALSEKPLFHIGPTFPLTVGLTYFLEMFPHWFGAYVPEVSGPITLAILALNVTIATILESIGLYWIYPTFLSDKPPVKPSHKFVHINGSRIPLTSLKTVKSDARYLIVTTETETSRHICRMRDFLTQVVDGDGVSPHRSYWVAKSNIIGLSGNRIRVHIGEDVPVARGKIQSSREWLKENGLPH